MPTRQVVKMQTLRQFSAHLQDDVEDEPPIDFTAVGLYIVGLQVCFAVVCVATTSVLACWLLPLGFVSSVRTLVLCVGVAAPLVRRPIRIGRARGVTTVFNALRPVVALYLVALVLEQLIHTCVADEKEPEAPSTLRALLQHSVSALLILSGLLRARRPRSESDLPFLLSGVCVVAAALLPPPPALSAGPLCEPTTLLGAGERLLRALLFVVVHAVLVYAGAPSANATHEIFVCVARCNPKPAMRRRAGRRCARSLVRRRSSSASLWVLLATPWALPIAPLQVVVTLFASLGDGATAAPYHSGTRLPDFMSESAPLNGATTPLECGSDLESGHIARREVRTVP